MIIDRKRQKRAVMIRLENVCFAYEKEIALRYVDLHINRGDSIVIQGPNGCGKSTLIKWNYFSIGRKIFLSGT